MGKKEPIYHRRFDRWLIAVIAVFSIGLASAYFLSYSKRVRLVLYGIEQEADPGAVAYLTESDFALLREARNRVTAIYRPSGGAPAPVSWLDGAQGRLRVKFTEAGAPRTLTLRPSPSSVPGEPPAGSLELVWAERSLIAWMVPGLRGPAP